MANIHQDLYEVRYDIQKERANVNAIKRQLKRLSGKEVTASTPERDANRIRDQSFTDPNNAASLKTALIYHEETIKEYLDKQTALKDELHSRFPLTPCALFAKLKYLKQKKKQAEKRLKRKRRRRY